MTYKLETGQLVNMAYGYKGESFPPIHDVYYYSSVYCTSKLISPFSRLLLPFTMPPALFAIADKYGVKDWGVSDICIQVATLSRLARGYNSS